jgi:hypothetical protein
MLLPLDFTLLAVGGGFDVVICWLLFAVPLLDFSAFGACDAAICELEERSLERLARR